MTDWAAFLQGVDLLAIVERDTRLRRVSSTDGGEWAGPCPFCGGRDRFRLQPNRSLGSRWFCRQCAPEAWRYTAIDYVTRRERISAREAIRRLAWDSFPARRPISKLEPSVRTVMTPPSPKWQQAARALLQQSEAMLWSQSGNAAREWLRRRGLTDETLRTWKVGLIPRASYQAAMEWGIEHSKPVWIPAGVVIPGEIAGNLWYLKIRRLDSEPKYMHIRGSRPALFGAETLIGKDEAIITEGELDALLVWQQLKNGNGSPETNGERVGVATLGSASQWLNLQLWARYLVPLRRLWICYDRDEAGQKGAARWKQFTTRARVITLPCLGPNVKDITDFHRAGGNLLSWFDSVRSPLVGEPSQVPTVETSTNSSLDSEMIRLILPADSPLPTIGAEWDRLATGEIRAAYRVAELQLCCDLVGVPVNEIINKYGAR